MARVPSFGRRLQSTAVSLFEPVAGPATKVTEEDLPRWVNGIAAAAADPIAAVIPGTISKGIPSRERCSASSPPPPNHRLVDRVLLHARSVPGGFAAPGEADPHGLRGRQR